MTPALALVAAPEAAPARFSNRELSWLDFNARVLELAADPAVPLLERVKFCAIFSSNLDEFFAVRVAGLVAQAASGMSLRSPDGRTPARTLAEVRERVLELTAAQSELWERTLGPALAAEGIVVAEVGALGESGRRRLRKLVEREILPLLTPLAVGASSRFPHVSPGALNLGVVVADPETGERRFARVKVPDPLPRLLAIGGEPLLVPAEDAVAHVLPELFAGMEIAERCVFRVTRDADFAVSDDADDLLEAVEEELRRRRFGDAVRLEVSSGVSKELLRQLELGLGVSADQIYRVDGLLDLSGVRELTALDRPELKDAPWRPVTQPRLDRPQRDLLSEVRRGDILAHHPYDAFSSSVDAFVRTSAEPDVLALKTTVYRTSGNAPVVPALIGAAESGKQSLCLVELKARFDEQRNVEWGRKLERAGVHVVYGVPGLKVHAKTTLLVGREGKALRRFAHIGTGNYHATNACVYEDLSLLTADEEITADVADLFNHVTGFGRPPEFRRLLVAPFSLRRGLTHEIRAVAAAAARGEAARIRIKVNALVDAAIVEELYAAAGAGARVELVVRGICVLRPVEGITVRSILGRFLEHSRLYVFEAGDRRSYWLGSADLMERNLDRRIEVVAPVDDLRLRAEIDAVFDALLGANDHVWELDRDATWRRLQPRKGERARPAQLVLMRRARARALRSERKRRAVKRL